MLSASVNIMHEKIQHHLLLQNKNIAKTFDKTNVTLCGNINLTQIECMNSKPIAKVISVVLWYEFIHNHQILYWDHI